MWKNQCACSRRDQYAHKGQNHMASYWSKVLMVSGHLSPYVVNGHRALSMIEVAFVSPTYFATESFLVAISVSNLCLFFEFSFIF